VLKKLILAALGAAFVLAASSANTIANPNDLRVIVQKVDQNIKKKEQIRQTQSQLD
jgi:hypothetical protein